MPDSERWIVICGSMSLHARMVEKQRHLEAAGLTVIVPPEDEELASQVEDPEYRAAKRRAALTHFNKVMDPRTFAVLAINADKHGIPNYIGPNTFAEVAVAFAQGKRIYLLHDVPPNLEDELRSWDVVPLRGDLGRLVLDFFACCQSEGSPAAAQG